MLKHKAIREQIIATLLPIKATKQDFPYRNIEEDQLPTIKVSTPRDDVAETKDNDPVFSIKWRVTIIVEVVVKGEGNVAAQADILSETVMVSLLADDTLNGLVIDLRLDSMTTEPAAEGQIPVAKATLNFEATYWHDFSKVEPGEPIPLHVWLAFSPDIGPDHIDDYVEVFHDPSAPPHP